MRLALFDLSRHKTISENIMNFFARFWMVFGLVLIVTVLTVFYSLSQKEDDQKWIVDTREEEFSLPVMMPGECVSMVEKWLKTTSVQEFSRMSRLLHISPQEGMQQLRQHLQSQGPIRRCHWLGMDQTMSIPAEKVMVIFESGDYRVAFLVFEEKQWKVDAESFLGHHTQPWSVIAKKGACETNIRVLIKPDHYYNGGFTDEKQWACMRMFQPDHEAVLYGYLKRGSLEVVAINQALESKSEAPVILRIFRRQDMNPNQFEIKSVIERGWLEARK
jgi:hypothetical protein